VHDERRPSYEELADLVVSQARIIEELRAEVARLESRVAELERAAGQNSGNSGKPPSRDSAAERQRQAEEREKKAAAAGGVKRRAGKQKGAPGRTLQMSDTPDEIIELRPDHCRDCGSALDESADQGYRRRQKVEVPPVKPVVFEYRQHVYLCPCGCETTKAFPGDVRSPVSYGPRARAIVAYLLARQHIPNRRVAEAMSELFGLDISIGAVDSVYADASRRLKGFIAALVTLLKTLPVLHVDETSDRLNTKNIWMHVVTGSLFTLIHASKTRGEEAIDEMGVLRGYRGVIVHDRLAMYWKLKRAKHATCGAHLLRDLAEVAVVATQTAWAAGLAALLLEINAACSGARERGWKALGSKQTWDFNRRYNELVAMALNANPEPSRRERNPVERRSYNLAVAFQTHKKAILRFMDDLQTPLTNNDAERALRPSKLHRKVSGCFRSMAGATRSADVRSYLATTQKNGLTAMDALMRLFEGNPWIPPSAE
jgi:transposase